MGPLLLFSQGGKSLGNSESSAGRLTLLQQELEVSVTKLYRKALFLTCQMMSLFLMYTKLSNV